VRLLIADDDRELASAMASYLRHCNEAVVSTVTTGGVDVLRNVERFHPDVILMDVMMPRLNGLTICRHILSCCSHTQIILLSGILSATHPLVVQSGAAAFLPKPVKLAELRRVVEEVVERVKVA
jgi:two-component system response regulator MprA